MNNLVVSGKGLVIDKELGLRGTFKKLTSLLGVELLDIEISDVFMVTRRSGPVLIVKLINTQRKLELMRWDRWDLEEFDYEVIYIPGKSNLAADALSRIKIESKELQIQVKSVSHAMSLANELRQQMTQPP